MNEIEQFRQAVYKLRDDGWLADWVEYVTQDEDGSYAWVGEPTMDDMEYWRHPSNIGSELIAINLPKVPPDQYHLAIVKAK